MWIHDELIAQPWGPKALERWRSGTDDEPDAWYLEAIREGLLADARGIVEEGRPEAASAALELLAEDAPDLEDAIRFAHQYV